MKLTSLKRTASDKEEINERRGGGEVAAPTSPSVDDFPYGLSLHLESEVLDKLGMKELPEIGAVCTIHGVGKVVRVGESASEKDESRNVEIQFTKLALTHNSSDEEDFEKGFKRGPKRRSY